MLARLFRWLGWTASAPAPVTGKRVYVDGWERMPRRVIDDGEPIELVGEMSYIDAIRLVDTNKSQRFEDWEQVHFTALVIPEPLNPFDVRATVVCVEGVGPIGYIARDHAEQVKQLREELISTGHIAQAKAKLIGGWGMERGRVIPPGVVVRLPFSERRFSGEHAKPVTPFSVISGWDAIPRVELTGKKLREVPIAGEFWFRERLAAMAATGPIFRAILVASDDGIPGFIVCSDSGPVGRSSVATSRAYGAMLGIMAERKLAATCEGFIYGEAPRLEVKILMPKPEEAEADLAAAAF